MRLLRRSSSVAPAVAVLFAAFALSACGGSSPPAPIETTLEHSPMRAIALAEWCDVLTAKMCDRAGACIAASAAVEGGARTVTDGCMQTAPTSCMRGRTATTPSGHIAAELADCSRWIDSLACEGFLTQVMRRTECQAHVPAPTSL
ncbi:hypothetical protein [Pendulispora albinea]|uniref:Lipoprotein n=1 Tax=Pendulispora albinea TaxID=2741071 RepID=A0ABZ2LS92_9BACT